MQNMPTLFIDEAIGSLLLVLTSQFSHLSFLWSSADCLVEVRRSFFNQIDLAEDTFMSLPEFSLKDKVALVTGGSKGIGRAIALAFAEAGSDVAVCSRGSETTQLEDVVGEIQRLGRRAMAIQADTSRKADVERMAENVINQFGAVDILVNNAGILIRGPLLEMSEDAWNRIMDVDLKGYFLCAQAVGKKMVGRKKGNYQYVNTVCIKAPPSGWGLSIAKLCDAHRVLAQELKDGIRKPIAPGLTRTDSVRPPEQPELTGRIEAPAPRSNGETSDLIKRPCFSPLVLRLIHRAHDSHGGRVSLKYFTF
jgi:NAD(P)-dependent dehydrogenase (short-subunit alcohol dehydrogenase family)